MRVYEGMFLLDPALSSDWPAVEAEINRLMERAEARLLGIKNWDERKLAYPIAGRKRGLYALTYFEAEADRLTGIERDVQLSEKCLRALLIRRDRMTPEEIRRSLDADPPRPVGRYEDRGGRGEGRRGGDGGRGRGAGRSSDRSGGRSAPAPASKAAEKTGAPAAEKEKTTAGPATEAAPDVASPPAEAPDAKPAGARTPDAKPAGARTPDAKPAGASDATPPPVEAPDAKPPVAGSDGGETKTED